MNVVPQPEGKRKEKGDDNNRALGVVTKIARLRVLQYRRCKYRRRSKIGDLFVSLALMMAA